MDQSANVTLNRLLSKLSTNLDSPTTPSTLRTSQFERNRIGANIEHARTLLLTLEKQSATIRVQNQRHDVQQDLQQKRELVKRLNARLQELNQLDDEAGTEDTSDESDEDEEVSTLLKEYAPARRDTQAGINTGEPPPPTPSQQQQSQQQRPADQPNEFRSRRAPQASDNRTEASTTARESLFANRSQPAQPGGQGELESHELRMSHNQHEQDALSGSLISLAQALKQSAQQMGVSIESEKDVMKRAEGSLDKSAQGMEAAEKRMGMLRRMSEGQGWWGRVKLYGFIFGLWVFCFLLVFVGPKLRL